jgi:hypothetical protein
MTTNIDRGLLREAAEMLSRSITSEDGARVARLCRILAANVQGVGTSGTGAGNAAAGEEALRVGIWQRQKQDAKASFMRRQEEMDQWHEWANVGRIEPKGSKLRVLLVGESVARGYFYDPVFTPAAVLAQLLKGEFGSDAVEVIDLARSNMSWEIRELAISALSLEPDAVVLFCGNNWRLGVLYDHVALECYIAALKTGGVAGLRDSIINGVRQCAEQVVRDIAEAYGNRGIPLFWIVPEFNLADWHEQRKNAPHLGGDANREWLEHFGRAEEAMRSGDFCQASRHAREMMKIDDGLSATGALILADCERQQGHSASVRECLEFSRDADIWDWMAVKSPRVSSQVQSVISAQKSVPGNFVIDLRELISEQLGADAVPDRRWFLDYCHLTSEGIRVSMAAAAAALLRRFKGTTHTWAQLYSHSPAPTRAVEADARFLAAMHNAHWGQPPETILRLCAEALQASSGIADVMALVAQLQSDRVPTVLSQVGEQSLAVISPAVQHFIFRQHTQRFDRALVTSICQVLAGVQPDRLKDLDELRAREHSPANHCVDLLDHYYSSDACQPYETSWNLPQIRFSKRLYWADYYRAYWRESLFIFGAHCDDPVALRLVLRLECPEHETREVTVSLNRERIWQGPVGESWMTVEVDLQCSGMLTGANEIRLLWPDPIFPGVAAVDLAADRLARGIMLPLRPVFGEIHQATVGPLRNRRAGSLANA